MLVFRVGVAMRVKHGADVSDTSRAACLGSIVVWTGQRLSMRGLTDRAGFGWEVQIVGGAVRPGRGKRERAVVTAVASAATATMATEVMCWRVRPSPTWGSQMEPTARTDETAKTAAKATTLAEYRREARA